MMTVGGRIWLARIAVLAAVLMPQVAHARGGWQCTYEGTGSDPARYLTRYERRGEEFVEPHWPASVAYRVLVDTRDILIAVHAYAIPPTFRREARGAATVLVINKVTGHLRRSSAGGDAEQNLEGVCARY